MKTLKTIGFMLFLMTGFAIPACEKTVVDSCDGVVFQNYFDIQGVHVSTYTDYFNQDRVLPSETITFAELDKMYIDYQVLYITSIQAKRDWSFSLIPTANACSYIPGTKGSKEEALVSFSITTLNDFDADHLADTNINDLFDYYGSKWQPLDTPISLVQFLEEQTGNLQGEGMILELKKAPELNQEFQVKVVMELSTGEVYEIDSEPIIIVP